MKKSIIILLLFALQILPVAASEQEGENQVYAPESGETGGTIYGSISGKALGDQEAPSSSNKKEEQTSNGKSTGTNTGDPTIILFWIVLFAGSYIVLRKYVNGIEQTKH